ncbi:hypothetical protein [Deinococcus navajonensis]|uniref:Uncharacterized protein n=1 Tax=Deinococcus navajonensis TaxID=309884 RepID=A0ABV8XIX8_9DEIO
MGIDHLPAEFIWYVKEWQAATGYESSAWRALAQTDVRRRIGRDNYVITDLEPPVVSFQPWFYGWDNDVVRHELAHLLLAWSRVEAHLIAALGSREAARPFIEALCNQALAFLQITQPMVDDAVKKHGVSAKAVRQIMRVSGARADRALHRLIQDDPDAQRAGFITSGNYIQHISNCNFPLPFWLFDRVPEPMLTFPAEANATAIRTPKRPQIIGVCWG